MDSKERKKVLISGFGTSDPVRTSHDGPLMHIMRHYHPDIVYIYVTREIHHQNENDSRIMKMMNYIKENWSGYQFSYELISSEIENPSDLDMVAEDMRKNIDNVLVGHEDDQIFLNLSSGTPQMKTYLSILSLNTNYDFTGVQVANPEKKSGNSERTNREDYSVEEELICNLDEEQESEDRTSEPKFLYYRRQQQLDIIKGLLKNYNYSAIMGMSDVLSKPLMSLVKHLQNRIDFNFSEAIKYGNEFQKNSGSHSPNLFLGMIPWNKNSQVKDKDFHIISEYFLILKTLQEAEKYNEFVLRLNPFFVNLEQVCWEKASAGSGRRYRYSDISDRNGVLNPDSLRSIDPDLFEDIIRQMGSLQNKQLSLYVLRYILNHYNLPENWMSLFDKVYYLNQNLRNSIAHTLTSTTDDEILLMSSALLKSEQKKENGLNARGIVIKTGELLTELYKSEYSGNPNNGYFNLYDRCNEYIENTISPEL